MSTGDFVRKLPDHGETPPVRRGSFWQLIHVDPILSIIVAAILAFGLVVIYSASDGEAYYVKRQLIIAGLGAVLMVGVAQVPLAMMQRWIWVFYLLGITALILVNLIGIEVNGARRWLNLRVINFQPSELLKLALPMTVAAYLSPRALPPKFKYVAVATILICVPAALIVVQPDLGTCLLVSASGFAAIFLAGIRWRYLVGALLILLISAPLVWQVALQDYQRTRIITMFNPEEDRLGAGWNIIQSKIAIGSGGWEGKGWMQGTQSQLNFLPESHTDFIIAVLAEEFGFRGVLVLAALYLALLGRGLWISLKGRSCFARLAAGSLVTSLFVYIFVNMGMVSGILPVVGAPLPLVSYGGTSLISLFMLFGVLMAVATDDSPVKS